MHIYVDVVLVRLNQRHFGLTGQKHGNDVALFWCNVMMSYLTLMITECQTAQADQIWFQHVRFNLLKKTCDEIRVLIVPSFKKKRLTETNCTRINTENVIVEIIAG